MALLAAYTHVQLTANTGGKAGQSSAGVGDSGAREKVQTDMTMETGILGQPSKSEERWRQ